MPQYEATCSGSKKASCNCTEFSSDENSSLCDNCHHYDWVHTEKDTKEDTKEDTKKD